MTFPTPRAALMGEPPSPDYQPRKADLVSVLEQIQSIAATQTLRDFHTDPDDLPTAGNTTGDKRIVLALYEDGGGVYSWTGAAWTRIGTLPAIFTSDIYAEEARNWAIGEGEPGGPGTRSARFWAEQAERWGVFLSIAEGLAQTEPGDVFSVIEPGTLSFYENVAGTESLLGSIEGTGNFTSSNDIVNASSVTGDFVTQALNTLNTGKAANQQPPDPSNTADAAAYVWTTTQVNSAALAAVGQMPVNTINFSAVSQVDIPFPAGVYETELAIYITAASVSDSALDCRFTRDNFATVINAAGAYRWGVGSVIPGVAYDQAASASDDKMRLIRGGGNSGLNTSPAGAFVVRISAHGISGIQKNTVANGHYLNAIGNLTNLLYSSGILLASPATDPVNGLRIFPNTGTITGRVDVLIRR